MLERVVAVECVRLRWKVEGDVVDEVGPGVGYDLPGSRHQSFPLAGAEQKDDINNTVRHPEQHAEEVPVPGHADGVPIAGKTDPGRQVAGIVLGCPHSVLGHFNRA